LSSGRRVQAFSENAIARAEYYPFSRRLRLFRVPCNNNPGRRQAIIGNVPHSRQSCLADADHITGQVLQVATGRVYNLIRHKELMAARLTDTKAIRCLEVEREVQLNALRRST
jgi:hypothetical protein